MVQPPSRPRHGAHVAYLAVALASAVTVLAGFSYATSTLVSRIGQPRADASMSQNRPTDSPDVPNPARATGAGWRASRAPWVRRDRVTVRFEGEEAALRITVPIGRPLEIVFAETIDDPVEFENVAATHTPDPKGDAVCLPPLDPGAYPFSTRSGRHGGVVVAR